MRLVDDEFLVAVVFALGSLVERVDIDRGRPFFDVELIRDPYVDMPATFPGRFGAEAILEEMGRRFVDRVKELRVEFGAERSSVLLVSYGNPRSGVSSIDSDTSQYTRAWAAALERASETEARGRWMSVADTLCCG